MNDNEKTREQLINKIEEMRERIANLEKSEAVRERLNEGELQYRTLLDTMNDGFMVRDKDGSLSYFNDRLCQMWGYTRDEINRLNTNDFLDEENLKLLKKSLADRAKGIDYPYELTWTKKNGQKLTTIMSPRVIFDKKGCFKGSIVVITDITQRKKIEETLAQQAAELKRSNAELEQFAYVASHDLQEPLRKIQAFSDRLTTKSSDRLDKQGLDYLERIQNAAKRMQTLISELMVFSRVTTQNQPCVPVDLSEIIRKTLSNLEISIEKTNAYLEIGKMPTIEGDPTQMLRLMQNLISNALKFRKEDTPVIIKLYSKLLKNRTQCQIFVEDNGIGFEQKYSDRIFGVFQRLHGRSTYDGTGIGLAICRKIADHHGGSITAESKPGEGTLFIVTLPMKGPKQNITAEFLKTQARGNK